MWGTDLATTVTGKGQAAVFVAIDHRLAECMGLHAAQHATRFEALEPSRQGGGATLAALQGTAPAALAVRHDHGSHCMAHDVQAELRFLGITRSPALIPAPEGNGWVERFIPRLKNNLVWVQSFATAQERRQARSSSARPATRPGSSSGTASGPPRPFKTSSFTRGTGRLGSTSRGRCR
jgi:hypothetical protein